MANYRFRIESGPRDGEVVALPQGEAGQPHVIVVGRGSDADLRFDDSTMSRHHAELRWHHGAWHIVNLSKHGSYVGRKHVTGPAEQKLNLNDTLILGETKVILEADTMSVATPGVDTLTPQTPTIARAPTLAGYDPQGKFHTGQTLLGGGQDMGLSFVSLGASGEIKFKKRRLYFLGILLVLGCVGCLATGVLIVLPTLREHPQAMLVATLFGLLPAIPYLLFFKFLDRNDQIPWRNLLSCAIWGATAGCGAALVLNSLGEGAIQSFVDAGQAWSLTATFVAPLTEEVVKGMAVLVVFWILHDEFDNALEGLILGAASGLGFAVIENCIYNVGFLMQGTETLLLMGSYRAVVNALIGHPIYTAMTGAGLGLLRETPRSKRYRLAFPIMGLALAIGMHVTWNAAALSLGKVIGDESGLVTLAINTVVFGGAGLLFFVAAYVFAASRERRVLVAYLSEEVEKGFVQAVELDSYSQWFGRLRFELGGLFNGGLRVYLKRKSLRRAQVELAFRKWHLAQGDATKGNVVDAYIHDARIRIRDARNALNALEGVDFSSGEGPSPG